MKFENIKKSKKFSKEKIDAIQKEFKDSINNKNISIVTTGSFARGEANKLSDLDIFIIVKNNTNELLFEEKEKISQIVSKHIPKNVGDSGTFGIDAIETIENLLKAICLRSANDASVALAEHISGSEELFVKKMNSRTINAKKRRMR